MNAECRIMKLLLAFLMVPGLWSCCCGRGATGGVERSDSIDRRVVHEVRIDTVEVALPREAESRMSRTDSISRVETSLAVSHAEVRADGTLLHRIENKTGRMAVAVTSTRDSIVTREVAGEVREFEAELSAAERWKIRSWWWIAGALALSILCRIAGRVSGVRF